MILYIHKIRVILYVFFLFYSVFSFCSHFWLGNFGLCTTIESHKNSKNATHEIGFSFQTFFSFILTLTIVCVHCTVYITEYACICVQRCGYCMYVSKMTPFYMNCTAITVLWMRKNNKWKSRQIIGERAKKIHKHKPILTTPYQILIIYDLAVWTVDNRHSNWKKV